MEAPLTVERIVAEHPTLFAESVRESPAAISELESALGVPLPTSVKSLVLFHGSGLTNAVPNLKTSIADTHRFRTSAALPSKFVVLEDGNDAGVVLLDTSSDDGRVIWVDAHAVHKLADEAISKREFDVFERFEEWLLRCVFEIEGEGAI